MRREILLANVEIAEREASLAVVKDLASDDAAVQGLLDNFADSDAAKLASQKAKLANLKSELASLKGQVPTIEAKLEASLAL